MAAAVSKELSEMDLENWNLSIAEAANTQQSPRSCRSFKHHTRQPAQLLAGQCKPEIPFAG
eukprot:scaffold47514_cov13-Tisochrysis_lutea.AAC.1